MKRTLYLFVIILLSSTCINNVDAQKKSKRNQDETSFNWKEERPKSLSNVKEIDNYILYCDTIWDRIQSYRDSVTFFKIDTVEMCNYEGAPVYVVKIKDENNVERGFWSSMVQYLRWTASGIGITADAALINLSATTATAAITSNPLLALSYGKCLLAAPKISGIAFNEIKYITGNAKNQARIIKQLRENQTKDSTDQTILIPITDLDIDLEDLVAKNGEELGLSTETTPEEQSLPQELEGLLF